MYQVNVVEGRFKVPQILKLLSYIPLLLLLHYTSEGDILFNSCGYFTRLHILNIYWLVYCN